MLVPLVLLFSALSFGSYFFLHAICAIFYKTQNLKRRYDARWALVTGSSSGIVALCLSVAHFRMLHGSLSAHIPL
jgi:hypothetical protein